MNSQEIPGNANDSAADAVDRVVMTDRKRYFIKEGFRMMRDRLERASVADDAVAYDMLGRIMKEARTLRNTLRSSKRS
jgi:hypothetical protein